MTALPTCALPTSRSSACHPQERELNPYLKDGGSGVPPSQAEGGAAPAAAQRAAGVGDGGASWRLKALKRAQQQAETEVRRCWLTQCSWMQGHLCSAGVLAACCCSPGLAVLMHQCASFNRLVTARQEHTWLVFSSLPI